MAKVTASDINKARVVVEIDGEEYTLIPSPGAILFLSDKYGGFGPLNRGLGDFNVRAMGDIVIAGLGLGGKEANDMMMKIIAAPEKLEIIRKLSIFVGILANGGKAPKDDTAEEEGSSGPL
jgi:hypothetical protein